MSLEELDFDPFEGGATEPTSDTTTPDPRLEALEELDVDPFGPDDGFADQVVQNIVEFGKGVAPGAVKMVGTGLKGRAGLKQGTTASAQAQTEELVNRVMSVSELTDEEQDQLYKDIGRSGLPLDVREELARGFVAARTKGEFYEPSEKMKGVLATLPPLSESSTYQAGETVQRFGQDLAPAAPGYEESPGRLLGEGLGSMAAGAAASVVGGPVLAAELFALAGSGESIERAVQAGASEDQIIKAARAGLIPGLTDSVPVEVLLGRIPIAGKYIKVPANMLGRVLRRIGRVGLQAFVEGVQEGGQEFLQNLIAREIYNPDQSLTEGVLPSAGVGAGVGAIAETGKQLLRGFAGRRRSGRVPVEHLREGDVESPIPTDLIAEGRQILDEATGTPPPGAIPEGAVPAEDVIGAEETGTAPISPAPTVPIPEDLAPAAEAGPEVASPDVRDTASSSPGGQDTPAGAGSTVQSAPVEEAVPTPGTPTLPTEPAPTEPQAPIPAATPPAGLESSPKAPSETAQPTAQPEVQGTYAARFGSAKQQNQILVRTRNRLRRKLGDRLTIRRQGNQWIMRLKEPTAKDTAVIQKELERQHQISLDRSERARARGAPRKAGPVGLAEAIARDGGIVDFRGELKSRDLDKWHVGKPGMPKLVVEDTRTGSPGLIQGGVKESTKSLDYRLEWAKERNYLPENATVNDLIAALEGNRTAAEPGAEASQTAREAKESDLEELTRDDIKRRAREMGEPIGESEIDEVLRIAGSEQLDGDTAFEQYVERKAIQTVEEAAEESGDESYNDNFEDIPFDAPDQPGQADEQSQAGQQGQPRQSEDSDGGRQERPPPREDREAQGEPPVDFDPAAVAGDVDQLTADDLELLFDETPRENHDDLRAYIAENRPDLAAEALDLANPIREGNDIDVEALNAAAKEKAQLVYDTVQEGHSIAIPSNEGAVQITDPSLLQVKADGLYVRRGRNWDFIPSTALDSMVAQARRYKFSGYPEELSKGAAEAYLTQTGISLKDARAMLKGLKTTDPLGNGVPFWKTSDLDKIIDDSYAKLEAAGDLDLNEVENVGPVVRPEINSLEDVAAKPENEIFPPPGETVRSAKQVSETLSPEQAKARLDEWKAEAKRIGREEDHSNEVVLSLFDETGVWSKPWKDAGYHVIQYDLSRGDDLLTFFPSSDIIELYRRGKTFKAVLSAPPCTSFAGSGAHSWRTQHDVKNVEQVENKYGYRAAKHFDTPLDYAITLARITEVMVEVTNPEIHVLENPIGRTAREVGLPAPTLIFQPNHFGDPYTKNTQLWGVFNPNLPLANVNPTEGSKITTKLRGDKAEDKKQRSATPEGFAYAFFIAQHQAKEAAAETPQGPSKPLYVYRPVTNAKAILLWAKAQGFKTTLAPEDMHVTVAYSKEAMDWNAVDADTGDVQVKGGKRSVEQLGDKGAVVLKIANAKLQENWQAYRDAGASWDFEGYQPHVTITYDKGDVDLAKVKPYTGQIKLGPEIKEDIDPGAAENLEEAPTGAASEDEDVTVTVPTADADEALDVTFSAAGPWDFNDTWPAPDRIKNQGREREGRDFLSLEDDGAEGVLSTLQEWINEGTAYHSELAMATEELERLDRGEKPRVKISRRRGASDAEHLKAVRDKVQGIANENATQLDGWYTSLLDYFSRRAAEAINEEAKRLSGERNEQIAEPLGQEEAPAITTEQTDQGEQTVLPGAEQISVAEQIKRGSSGRSRARAEQRSVEGLELFDPEARAGAQPDIFDQPAAPAAGTYGKSNTLFTEDAAEKARKILRDKMRNQLSAGIDPEIVQAGITLAGYHIEAGARSFAAYARAMVNDLGDGIRPFLKSWYNAVRDYPGFDATGMTPYEEVAAADTTGAFEDVPGTSEGLESDREIGSPQDELRQEDVRPRPGPAREGARAGGEPDGQGGLGQDDGGGLFDDGAAPVRERRDTGVQSEASPSDGLSSQRRGQARSRAPREPGLSAERIPATTVARAAVDASGVDDSRSLPSDYPELDAALPELYPEQRNDVGFAEKRFAASPSLPGVLFTNGTGTGKTFSGMGIAKRFHAAGKSNILFLAPSQGILDAWVKAGEILGVPVTVLPDTQSNGRGPTATTYANFRDNDSLGRREWDLIITDEAQHLSQNADGEASASLRNLRAVSNHPDGYRRKAEMAFPLEYREFIDASDRSNRIAKDRGATFAQREAASDAVAEAYAKFNAKAEPYIEELKSKPRAKVVFLSATPFAYDKSIDYASGYLFDYGERKDVGGYNQPDAKQAFFIRHFGYRMKTGSLTKPDAEVQSEVMERQFHQWLREQGALSGRVLTVDKDYDRRFVLVDDGIGNQIDQAFKWLSESKFHDLSEYFRKQFDYLSRMRLLEAIKAHHAVADIEAHHALGRKVVVFHDYNEGGGFSPFAPERVPEGLKREYNQFALANPYIKKMDFAGLGAPIETLTKAFPDAIVYNGTIPSKKRRIGLARFNDDNDKKANLIIVQSAAGEAGLSAHDTTGVHQRALINLGMPNRPVTAIQEEGRIYRVGQASDAIFRYYNTGTNWERWTFASTISQRSGTVENLALGEQARALRQSFVDAFEESDAYPPSPEDGKGGKERDRALDNTLSEFDRAKTYYYARGKRTKRRRDQLEGIDYFATPEPVGMKMVEWANVKPGDRVLEPSAGHGAIARFFPLSTERVFLEPADTLASSLGLVSQGADVRVDRFENLHVVNKFDAIVMNPPFGNGAKTAMEHLAKAVTHLRNGGRIVALLPEGGMAAKRFEQFMESDASKNVYLAANISMPTVLFERAGTTVKTHIVVLEKQTELEKAQQIQQSDRDYSNAETINELFDRLEHSTIRDRVIPSVEEARVSVDEHGREKVTAAGVKFTLGKDSLNGRSVASPEEFMGKELFARASRLAEAEGGSYIKTRKQFEFSNDEQRTAWLAKVESGEEPATQDGVSADMFRLGQTKHSKTGADLYVVSLNARVMRDEYTALVVAAKRYGGYYSTFNRNGAIPGFQFKSEADRAAFLEAVAPKSALREPVARLTGDELGTGLDLRELRDAAFTWYGDNLRGTTVPMADGRVVRFNSTGQRKSLWGKGETLIRAVPAIRDIIAGGEVVDTRAGDRPHVRRAIVIAAPVEIAGTTHDLAVIVHETVNGDFQYDLTRDTGDRPNLTEGPATAAAREPALEGVPGNLNVDFRKDFLKTSEDAEFSQIPTDELFDALRKELDRIGLERVQLVVRDRLLTPLPDGGTAEAVGQYLPISRLMRIAQTSDDPFWTLDHETIHALRAMGLFTEGEWKTMVRKATANARRMRDIDSRYARSGLSRESIEEEAVADMHADFVKGLIKPDNIVARAFRKIASFFEALRNAMRGLGFTTAADVSRAVFSGEVGQRRGGPARVTERQTKSAFKRRADAETEARAMTKETGLAWFVDPMGDGFVVSTRFVPVEASGETPDLLATERRARMLQQAPSAAGADFYREIDPSRPLAAEEEETPLSSLRPEDVNTSSQRRTVMGRLLRDGAPIDRVFRLPFDVFGGITETGEWKPGAGLFQGARKIITESKFDEESRFAWLNRTLHVARSGLVDRYGLSQEYAERERKRGRDERAIMLEGVEILKTLKEQDVSIEEAKILQDVLTGEAIGEERWEKLAVPIRQAIDQLGQEAVSVGLLSRESYERNRGTYLHRVYMKHEAEQDGLSRWVGRVMGRNRKKIIGDQFKGRGMFLEVDHERILRDLPGYPDAQRGRLVQGEAMRILDAVDETGDLPETGDTKVRAHRRIFWPAETPVPERFARLRDRGIWEVRFVTPGKVTLWRDFTREERESMGEIMDARYTIGKTFMMMAHDLATGRFYKDIAENGDWSVGSQPNSRWVDAADFRRVWNDETVEWVRVPDTNIPDTGGKKRYGALAGRWVRAAIWRDINELDILQRPTLWTKLLTQWKLNKTARSPVVHMNNVMSNMVLMDLADIGITDFVSGVRAYARGTQDYEEAAANGAFGSDMISQEVRRNILEPLLEELKGEVQGAQGALEGRIGMLGKLADRIWSITNAADRKMVDLYRLEDEVFRMATYMRRRKLGDTPEAAAAIARDQFLDYDIRAPWVNIARRSVLPFASYVYRAAPVIAKSLAEHPWKLAKYFTIAYALNALAYMLVPGDEDKERRSIREEEQGYTWIGTPRMLRMPWRDAQGNPVFLDIRRWIPAGDVFDIGQGSSAIPFPAPLLFGGPLMLGAELFLNRSAFTGKDIVNERTDDAWDRTGKIGDWAWKSWMPSAAWVPGSWYWSSIGRAMVGARDYADRPYSLPQAVSSSFGVKVKPQDVEQNFANWAREFNRVERDLRFEMRTIARDRERGAISEQAFRNGQARILRKMETLGRRRQEVLDPRR